MGEQTFAQLGLQLPEEVWARLAAAGIARPNEVQARAIPAILAGGRQQVGSPTGSGKTLAYVLPLVHRAAADADFRALILAPSTELALQILAVVHACCPGHVRALGLVGAGRCSRQQERLKRRPQLMVGTPGRAIDLMLGRKIRPQTLGALVLDEADAVLCPSHQQQLAQICGRPEFRAQRIVASATLGPGAAAWVAASVPSAPGPPSAARPAGPLPDTIDHYALPVCAGPEQKQAQLVAFVRGRPAARAILFVNHTWEVTALYQLLRAAGIGCLGLSAQRNKLERQRALDALKDGRCAVLVATDAAAMGLDVPGLDWVLHWAPATSLSSFIHRTGRVGRAGARGSSAVFLQRRDTYTLRRLAGELRLTLQPLAA